MVLRSQYKKHKDVLVVDFDIEYEEEKGEIEVPKGTVIAFSDIRKHYQSRGTENKTAGYENAIIYASVDLTKNDSREFRTFLTETIEEIRKNLTSDEFNKDEEVEDYVYGQTVGLICYRISCDNRLDENYPINALEQGLHMISGGYSVSVKISASTRVF